MVKDDLHNEKELLSFIAEGDEASFALLFRHYSNRIYSIAFKITGSTVLSEEIVQDVFLKIWLKRADLAGINDFRAYFFVVARNHIYRVLKQNATSYRTISFRAEDQSLVHNDTENSMIEKEYSLLLKEAIDRLPAQQQKVYVLMKEQGYKREEVAGLLKIHPETIKSHLALAMRNIRAYCLLHSDIHFGIMICLLFHSQDL